MVNYMKELIKCHLNYLFSKRTIIVSLIVLFFILISNLVNIINIDLNLGYKENNYLYFYNSFLLTKIIIVIYAIFIFGYSFLEKSEQYVIIIIASGVPRIKVIISKLVSLIFVLFLINYYAYFLYAVFGYTFYKDFIFMRIYLYSYTSLLFLSLFYGLLSVLLIQYFKSIYLLLIPFGLYNFSEIINDEINWFIKIINLIVPHFQKKLTYFYGIIHIVILIIILLVFNINYYLQKDL